ncbi:Translocation protein [Sparassis crispa]|uniref:Translocation protein n=1 Tax=Sparassis crispa TaxID=139825 RepID=A0A401GWG2_9APHY|nr:Translocation protein [Sparassis crispa]GBE86540.1 Translocation protein [Sparassis crispa]
MVIRPPDPVMEALIEASISSVDIALGPPDNTTALCGKHSLEKCVECDADYVSLNRLSRILLAHSTLRCPPPPQIVTQKLTMAITNIKEEGNTLFKGGLHEKAIQRYTMAINMAAQRPPWEAQQIMREELSTVLSNRSAAFLEAGDYVGALVDAETVIQLKRPWSKGHFRKARALMRLERYEEAKEAIQLGLSYEPDNSEMSQMLASIESALKARMQDSESRIRASKNVPTLLPILAS